MSASTGAILEAVGVSPVAARVFNPIRRIVDQLKRPESDLPFISLSIGDPTITGIFRPPPEVVTALHACIDGHDYDGYPPSTGLPKARQAVADAYTTSAKPIKMDDVILASGASHALEMAIEAICPPKAALLVPRPGFSLYATIAATRDIEVVYYDLCSDRDWEIDLPALSATLAARAAAPGAASKGGADGKITGIILCNPSNPCGSAWSDAHCSDIAALLQQHRGVTGIADEIYAGLVFDTKGGSDAAAPAVTAATNLGNLSFAQFYDGPLLVVGGLAKRYMVPGWRLGWLVVVDGVGEGAMPTAALRAGLVGLTTLILGPNSLIQAIVPDALAITPSAAYHVENNAKLQKLSKVFCDALDGVDGLTAVRPGGAMYAMVKVDAAAFGYEDDVAWSRELLKEQNIMVLPGSVFQAPGFFRVVVCNAEETLLAAVDRIKTFCAAHRK